MKTPFKMKGSPMQRNFGISPVKQAGKLPGNATPPPPPKAEDKSTRMPGNATTTTSVKEENKETKEGGYVITRGAILDNYRLGLFNKAQRNILLEDHGFEIPKDESSFEDPE